MGDTITISLGYPRAHLSPNARSHWRTKARAVKNYRQSARVAAGINRQPPELHQRATVQISHFYPGSMPMDPDNAIAAAKSAIDGVQDSGFIANDRTLTYLPLKFSRDAKNPRVEITFTATP